MGFLSQTGILWFILATAIKLLLIPSYRSTDFEVHRNWLAITHSLPISKWYYENTSEWTLDYPPFFAYFEYGMSQVAPFFDPNMLDVKNLNYASPQTILFQRLSVIVTDTILFLATIYFARVWTAKNGKQDADDGIKYNAIVSITVLNAGLFIIDHIHFQYNGFLFGIFILSIALVVAEKQILGAAVFAALLNFKHIYLYVAPVYFIYLFRAYCFPETGAEGKKKRSFSFARLVGLGIVVAIVFAISLGPFALMGQLLQLKERLFPFKRGLVHAYWAPNFWALYVATDRIARLVLKSRGINLPGVDDSASATSGLVGVGSFAVLPNIAPIVTFIATSLSMLPVLYHLWRKPVRENFIPALVHCGMCSFMLGWHVHEKAILLPVIPLGLIASENLFQRRMFVLMATVGHYGLFPLLFNSTETPIKIFLLLGHTTLSITMLQASWKDFSFIDKMMLVGLIPVQAFYSLLHPWILGKNPKYDFLPLLVVSVYCAAVLVLLWIQYAVGILRNRVGQAAKKKME
eukprot:TRINITY_DN15776_c0_g1_i1.p1 TRINITY_DN15776_c0_g1~~TRINITY_DN15776_c0_g1_i1.p1  ORF type:complete len:519 (-),score=51.46 TRINITY_DN15776_c0_g1_i1:79-1635(-)